MWVKKLTWEIPTTYGVLERSRWWLNLSTMSQSLLFITRGGICGMMSSCPSTVQESQGLVSTQVEMTSQGTKWSRKIARDRCKLSSSIEFLKSPINLKKPKRKLLSKSWPTWLRTRDAATKTQLWVMVLKTDWRTSSPSTKTPITTMEISSSLAFLEMRKKMPSRDKTFSSCSKMWYTQFSWEMLCPS